MDANEIPLNPSAVARALGSIAFVLVLASVAGRVSIYVFGHDNLKGFVELFHVDTEHNVPTFFSVLLLLIVALLLSVIAVLNRKQRGPHAPKWAVLAAGFLFLGFDEAFMVHEHLSPSVRALLGEGIPGAIHFGWTIPGIAVVIVLAFFFRTLVLQLPAATRRMFLTAATLYLSGALGSDLFLSGPYAAVHGERNLTYSMLVTVEESLEMTGLIVFIWALLKYGANTYKEVRFPLDA